MWTVTRQIQYPTGMHVVEISAGGIDYTNPDALSPQFRGEFAEFADPREAVATARNIAQQWRRQKPGRRVYVAHGATGGMTLPFEPESMKELEAWAEKTWENTPKCARCGDVLGETKYSAGVVYPDGDFNSYDDFVYCSEYCAEQSSEYIEEKED